MELRTQHCCLDEHTSLSPSAERLLDAVKHTLTELAVAPEGHQSQNHGALLTQKRSVENDALSQRSTPHLILGLSGGIDSIALFHTLLAARSRGMLSFAVTHIDHEWRPESGEDRLFCQQLAQEHGVPFYATTLTELMPLIPQHKARIHSKEALAREARRVYFKRILAAERGDAIALAHHEDDQIETFFIRLIRGAHIGGLAAMERISPPFIRPFLTLPKALLETFVTTHHFTYRADSSNNDRAYLRNKIRLDLIPAFVSTDPRARAALLETLHSFRETSNTLNTLRDEALQRLTESDNRYRLDYYRALTPLLRKSVLLELLITHSVAFTPHTGLLAEGERFLLHKAGGTHTLGSTLTVVKKGNYFYFEAHEPESSRPSVSR